VDKVKSFQLSLSISNVPLYSQMCCTIKTCFFSTSRMSSLLKLVSRAARSNPGALLNEATRVCGGVSGIHTRSQFHQIILMANVSKSHTVLRNKIFKESGFLKQLPYIFLTEILPASLCAPVRRDGPFPRGWLTSRTPRTLTSSTWSSTTTTKLVSLLKISWWVLRMSFCLTRVSFSSLFSSWQITESSFSMLKHKCWCFWETSLHLIKRSYQFQRSIILTKSHNLQPVLSRLLYHVGIRLTKWQKCESTKVSNARRSTVSWRSLSHATTFSRSISLSNATTDHTK